VNEEHAAWQGFGEARTGTWKEQGMKARFGNGSKSLQQSASGTAAQGFQSLSDRNLGQ
jgi:hypothetical protein